MAITARVLDRHRRAARELAATYGVRMTDRSWNELVAKLTQALADEYEKGRNDIRTIEESAREQE